MLFNPLKWWIIKVKHPSSDIYRINISLMKINNTRATDSYDLVIFIRDIFFSVYVLWEVFLFCTDSMLVQYTTIQTSKGSSLPNSAGDQLEWTGGDFLPCSCHSNDSGHSPSLVTRLQRSSLKYRVQYQPFQVDLC